MANILNNKLARTQKFYKQNYYTADLDRVCELEELVNEWFELDVDIRADESRNQTLLTFGFQDLAFHDEDFQYMISHFTKENILTLEGMQVGGTDF